jgi:hypothetical protein
MSDSQMISVAPNALQATWQLSPAPRTFVATPKIALGVGCHWLGAIFHTLDDGKGLHCRIPVALSAHRIVNPPSPAQLKDKHLKYPVGTALWASCVGHVSVHVKNRFASFMWHDDCSRAGSSSGSSALAAVARQRVPEKPPWQDTPPR